MPKNEPSPLLGELAPGQCQALIQADEKGAVSTVILRYRGELDLDPNGTILHIPADELLAVAAQVLLLRHSQKAAMPGSGRILRPT